MFASSGYAEDLFNCGLAIPVEDLYAAMRVSASWHTVVLSTQAWADMISFKDRDNLVFRITLAEQGEDYNEMFDLVKQLVKCVTAIPGKQLTKDERNLLSIANKNVLAPKKMYGRIALARLESESNPSRKVLIENVLARLQREITAHVAEVADMLERLLKPTLSPSDQVFFHKMGGDINRWASELQNGEHPERAGYHSLQAFDAYRRAMAIAEIDLHPTDPVRLGTALNFSVFYYEIAHEPKKAMNLARTAFDDAITVLDTISEESYKDSTLIMQLLRDNLTLWTSDDGEN